MTQAQIEQLTPLDRASLFADQIKNLAATLSSQADAADGETLTIASIIEEKAEALGDTLSEIR